MVTVPQPPRKPFLPPSLLQQAPDLKRWVNDTDEWLNLIWKRTGGGEDMVAGSVPQSRAINVGTGMLGGGTLASDLNLTLDGDLELLSAVATQAFGRSLLALANQAALQSTAGTVIGTDVQAHDADLDSIAAQTNTAFGLALLTLANAAALRTAAGVTASGADTTYAFRANNLSDLANAVTARSNLGLGSIATQAANNVAITGGSITGITDLAVADGGTGASTAANARTNLGITSGTYTPTLTNTTNVAASTAYVCQYLQVGDIVFVSGKVDIDVTAATTNTVLGMSLPVASNLSAQENLGGTAVMASAGGGISSYAIIGDATNDRASILGLSGAGVANLAYGFSFMYRVI